MAEQEQKENFPFNQEAQLPGNPVVYTMPEKFLPNQAKKSGKSGKGIIFFLYLMIALVVIGGGLAFWYFFIYSSNGERDSQTNDLANTLVKDNQAEDTKPVVEPEKNEMPPVEIKFVAKDQDTKQEVSNIVIKLAGADSNKADLIQVSSLLPSQAQGRASQAIGAIYTIESAGQTVSFSQPTPFIFSYVEPDDLTTKKENSLRLFEETIPGEWQEVSDTSLDIVTNSITVNWQILPAGRVAIFSNLEEEVVEEINPEDEENDLLSSINPLVISLDTDGDELSDQEELFLYQSDKNLPDTDGDGYLDGSELINGYSPISTSTLWADNLTKEYNDEVAGFKVNYPATWLVTVPSGDVAEEQSVTFESPGDDFVQISVQDNQDSLTAVQWYASLVPGLDITKLVTKKIGNYTGVISPDNANFYLAADNKIYIFSYSTGLKTEVDYLTTFKMMYNSFRITANEG